MGALSFLNDVAGFADKAGQIAGPVQQIMSLFGKGGGANSRGPGGGVIDRYAREYGMNPLNRPMTEGESQAMGLYQELLNPDSQLLKSLTAADVNSLMAAQQNDIRSRVLSDRRETAMGRSPTFFNPERADETISYLATRGAPAIQRIAQQSALARIVSAAQGFGGFSGVQQGRQDAQFKSAGTDIRAQQMAGQANPYNNIPMGSLTGTVGKVQQGIGSVQQILQMLQQYQKPAPITQIPQAYSQMRYN